MKIQNLTAVLTITAVLLSGCASAAATATGTASSVDIVDTTTAAVSQAGASQGTTVVFTDDKITVSDTSGLEVEGTSLTVTAPGSYLLSGSCADGSVKVQKGTKGVTLVLNGLTLSADGTAPIVCAKSTEVSINVADGTENTLSDTESNNDETGNAEAENAVIKCKDGSNVTLCGTGTLNILANGKNGIRSGASTQEEGDASLTIRELTLNISAPKNDAVNAEALLNVESGSLTIDAGDDALHCDYNLVIGAENTSGPTVVITSCYEGLEGAVVDIYSGDISITASDDCINAANPDLTGYSYALNICGGNIRAYSSAGDGFDSNGNLTISGGNVTVWTANTADNQPLDADGTITISGGTVLAAGGSSGMGMNLNAVQPCVIFSTQSAMAPGQEPEKTDISGLLAKDSAFAILNDAGQTLLDGSAECETSFLLFSSDALTEGDSCKLSSGGNETEAEVQAGTVSTGGGGMGGPGGGRPDGDFRPGSSGDGQRPDNKDFDPSGKPDGNAPDRNKGGKGNAPA